MAEFQEGQRVYYQTRFSRIWFSAIVDKPSPHGLTMIVAEYRQERGEDGRWRDVGALVGFRYPIDPRELHTALPTEEQPCDS